MSDARARIKEVIAENYGRGAQREEWNSKESTDRVVQIFREALLHPDVIAQGDKGCVKPTNVERVVRNVLDAAGFGENDNGH